MNVWFDLFYAAERRTALFQAIKEKGADIICFQEVKPDFIDFLTNAIDWIQKDYYISDATGDFVEPYGVCILSRFPIKQLNCWSLPTEMARNCLIAELQFNDTSIQFATVHLESLDAKTLRRKQLEVISGILKNYPNALLMGDFNIDSQSNYSQLIERRELAEKTNQKPQDIPYPPLKGAKLENLAIEENYSDYQDVWPYLRPNDLGATYDSVINKMIDSYHEVRYDRILFKSTEKICYPETIELFGTERIPDLPTPVWLSDHFGLFLTLKFN